MKLLYNKRQLCQSISTKIVNFFGRSLKFFNFTDPVKPKALAGAVIVVR